MSTSHRRGEKGERERGREEGLGERANEIWCASYHRFQKQVELLQGRLLKYIFL